MGSMSDLAKITKRVIGGKRLPGFVYTGSRVYERAVGVKFQVLGLINTVGCNVGN